MKIRILAAMLAVALAAAMIGGATMAWFSDRVTSNENTFAAGTLMLNVDGARDNVVKFTVENMRPGSQPRGSYTIKNVGSISGFLNIRDISVSTEATPGTLGKGRLDELVHIKLFVDGDQNGWWSGSPVDTLIYDGLFSNLPTNLLQNYTLAAGAEIRVQAIINWWNNGDADNDGQGDVMTVNMTFELHQQQQQ